MVTAIEPERTGAVASATPLLVEIRQLAKAFGATQAIRDASFELRAGEVHALVGENGSGKSTLVKVLSGVHHSDAGTIALSGEPVERLGSPTAAQRRGIVTVFQEVLVSEARSVLDNVWLGVGGLLRSPRTGREKRALAQAAFDKLLGGSIDLDTPVEELSLSDRQAACIVRALLREPRVLILDEATSALDVATRDRLFEIVRELSASGVGVVFITHRMDELSEIGDRITVMRSGETVATLERGAWAPRDLVRLMTGSEHLTERARERVAAVAAERDVVLSVRGLRLRLDRSPIDVDIRAGELVGVAGLEGHGQDEFLDALRGAGAAAGEVVRRVEGREIAIRGTQSAAANGVAYVARERRSAIFNWMSIRENFGMPTLARDSRLGWLSPRATRKRFSEYVADLGIVLGSPEDRITTLSGGNQQKVVIARWLASSPQVLVLNDPTRGIDIGTKHQLYALLARLAGEGMAVVMLSSELDEHVELMDRVLVFREHAMYAELRREELSRNVLVSSFFGQSGDDDA
jgi:ABC-type sugar transport system ATPase subunit